MYKWKKASMGFFPICFFEKKYVFYSMHLNVNSNWSDVLEQYFTYCSYCNVLSKKKLRMEKNDTWMAWRLFYYFGKSTGIEGNGNNLNFIEMHRSLC